MHLEQVLRQLRDMRLATMAASYEARLKNGDHHGLSHEDFFALLVEDEYTARRNRKLSRMIGKANLKPEQACIENIRYDPARGFEKRDMMLFTTPTWIEQARNVIITGPTGSGKTYLAEAVILHACKMGYPGLKIRYRRFFEEIHAARNTGTLPAYQRKLGKARVLLLDDFVMNPISRKDLDELMDLVENREQCNSLMVTTQYPVDAWHSMLPDLTIADAICDRLIHGSIKLNLTGDSMRKQRENPTQIDRPEMTTKQPQP